MEQIEKLNKLYKKAETHFDKLFAEQRSNIRLYQGNHYGSSFKEFDRRMRASNSVSEETRLRLTKNHIQHISKNIINTVTDKSPDVAINPHNPQELQDRKAAELHRSVWNDIKGRAHFYELRDKLAFDFIVIGECWVRVGFDPNAGTYLGKEQFVDEMTGEVVEEGGHVFSGEVTMERFEGWSVLTDPNAKTVRDSKWVCVRELVPNSVLKKAAKGNKEMLAAIASGNNEAFTVYNPSTNSYDDAPKGMTLVKYWYYRPSPEHPEGYYYISTGEGIIEEGSLNGVFPMVFCAYEEVPTFARGYSALKPLRPIQAEINRTASHIAGIQLAYQDKLLFHSGSKIAHGGTVAGVRGIKYSGIKPEYLEGKTGDKFLPYLEHNIQELYRISNVAEEKEDEQAQVDPFVMIYRNLKNKKRFSLYSNKFEQFIIELAKTALKTAKTYYSEDNIIPAIGTREIVNISEFKSADDLSYQIEIEAMSGDAGEMMAKQLSMQHILQYVGSNQNLSKEHIGMIIKNMPFANADEVFNELTLDVDEAENIMLALERGEPIEARRGDNHKYILRRLMARRRSADFRVLPPEVQQGYEALIQQHEQIQAQEVADIQRAQAQQIPAGGGLITIPSIKDMNGKVIRVPYDSIEYVVQKLNEQGALNDAMQNEIGNQGAIADVANLVNPNMPQADQLQAPHMQIDQGAFPNGI